MTQLTEDDIWFCQRMSDNHSNSGYIVTTKNGLCGRTYHADTLINGKQPVYIKRDDKEIRMLCDPDTLIINGFID